MSLRRQSGEDVPLAELLGFTPDAGPARIGRNPVLNVLRLAIAVTIAGVLCAVVALPAVGGVGLAARTATTYWNDLPTDLPVAPLPQRSTILAADGSKIAEFFSENRIIVPLSQVPPVMRDALLSSEDSRFYSHNGIDLRGTLRALKNNSGGKSTQGGSTITQQYVKNVLLLSAKTPQERDAVAGASYVRKLQEAKYALQVERVLTKDQILEGYLNIAYFGNGAYGVGTAAQHYFGKSIADVTPGEAAMIAGMVKDPLGYDPTTHIDAATTRRNIVLDRMLELNKISKTEYGVARKAPITLKITDPQNGCVGSPYPFYCQWVQQTLRDDPAFGETPEVRAAHLYQGGMTIHTALDPAAQKIAQTAVDRAFDHTNRVAAASVTVQPGTGKVTTMAVNRDFGVGDGKTEILLPVVPEFQSGSTFKPFTLAAAIEQGYDLNAVVNAPSNYIPANMNSPVGGFHNAAAFEAGDFNASTAMWRSSNTWYVKLEEKVGVIPVADMAGRLGITSLPRTGERAITARDASLTLGSYEVSPLDMANAYATFAAHGVACRPMSITAITNLGGQPETSPNPDCHQAVAPGVADTVNSVLQGVIDGPDPTRTASNASLGRPAAGKTGTTNDNAAVWMVGYTPQNSTAVWVGDPRGGQRYPLTDFTAYGKTVAVAFGGETASPIWQEVMLGLSAGTPPTAFAPADPTVATGLPYTVPDVRGLTRDKAIQILQDAGFTVTIATATAQPDPTLTAGTVTSTSPTSGSTSPYGASIIITLTDKSVTNVTINDPRKPVAPPVPNDNGGRGKPLDSGNGIVTTGAR